jgi:predicted RNase H-like nuclease (RuvC/YqgF family)
MTTVWADKMTLLNAAIGAFMAYQLGDYIGNVILQLTGAAESQERWHTVMAVGLGPLGMMISGIAKYIEHQGDLALATETSEHKQDRLAKASEIAGRQITNYGEAVRIIANHFGRLNDVTQAGASLIDKYGESLGKALQDIQINAKLNVMAAEATKRYNDELGALSGTTLKNLTEKLKDTRFSIKELSRETGVSEATLKQLKDTLDDNAQSQKKAAQETKKHNDELRRQREEITKLAESYNGVAELRSAEKFTQAVKELGNLKLLTAAQGQKLVEQIREYKA